jgi:glycosyltransferase involved in cell wall biosynthesis
MVGGPDDRQRALYEETRRRAEEIPNLHFVGYVPYAEIDKHFDKARVLVNTSASEGFPNTFLQAWSRGIPSVSFVDSGAQTSGEAVGCIVRNLPEMAQQIEMLMSNLDRWTEESKRCLQYYAKYHRPDIVYAKYEQIFDRLVSGEPKSNRRNESANRGRSDTR